MSDVLADIQARMKAPKDKRNDFGKYNYRTAESILRAFKEVQPTDVSLTMSDTVTMVGSRLFLVATVQLRKGSEVIAEAHGAAMHALEKKGMDDAQITGACSSYARKYALCGLFAVDDSADDPDSKDNRFDPVAAHSRVVKLIEGCTTYEKLCDIWAENRDTVMQIGETRKDLGKSCYEARDKRKAELGAGSAEA